MFMTRDNSDLNLELSAAVLRRHFGPSNIPIIDDDMWGSLYVYGQEFGPMRVVRARTWEDAYEAVIDDLPTIDPSDMDEAFDGLDLEEGYHFQSNASGTGIVNVGHHEWMHKLTEADSITPVFTLY